MKTRYFLYTLLAAIIFAGCKPSVPSEYIPTSDMEDIIYDLCIAQGIVAGNSSPYDEKKQDLNIYKKDILKKYGYTEAEYDSSMVYYMTHTKHLHDVYESVVERLGNDAVAMGAATSDLNKFGSINASGDTANIWNERSTLVMSQFAPYNKVSFFIKADSTYKPGDRLMLDFDNKFIYQDGTHAGTAMIAVCYDDDSVTVNGQHISSSMNYTVEVAPYSGHKIKSIRGFIYHPKSNDASATTLKLMVVNNIRLIRFHQKESADTIKTDTIKPVVKIDSAEVKKEPEKRKEPEADDENSAF